MTLLGKCAEFVCCFKPDRVPAVAVSVAKNAVIDTVAAMLSGVKEPVTRTILAYVVKDRAAGKATVVGTDCRFSPASAALVNGTMAHAVDYDDILTSTRSHPSAVLVPAVLAVGESLRRSGRDIVAAYLVGLEIVDKVGSLVAFSQYDRGWHTTSTIGVLGAAAASSRLMGLSERQTAMALGIAASMAGGLLRNFGTMTKPLHCGLAAQSGVMAAALASDGLTASDDVFSGKDGYFRAFSEEPQGLQALTFGEPLAVISPGLYLKRYPCCFATHRAIDAILNIRSQNKLLNTEDISTITCLAPSRSFTALIHDSPRTGLEGKFSMQYAVAVGLLDGGVNVHTFTDEMVQRKQVRFLMERVRKVEDPSLSITDSDGTDRRFVEVKVTMVDGRTFSKRVTRPKGSVDNPLTDREISDKFLECASAVLPAERQIAALGLLQGLESLQDISEVMRCLAFSPAGAEV